MGENIELIPIALEVNGITVERSVEPRSLLVDFIRDDLGLTGTKKSCELTVCGVCTVLVNGQTINSCNFLTVDADGKSITTVEGLSDGQNLHPLQQSFVNHQALQCGFCTPGFLMMSKALLDENPHPSREEIVEHLEGSICRCTGYRFIVEAVEAVAMGRTAPDEH